MLEGILLVAIILLSTFLAKMKAFSKEAGSKRLTSCCMFSFRVTIKRSKLLSYDMPSTVRLKFWNCWMCSVTEPCCLKFINWVKKELFLISSWYAINSYEKMDQDIIEPFFLSQIHWYRTNCGSSKYKDAIITFCWVGTWCRSKKCSIWQIQIRASLP